MTNVLDAFYIIGSVSEVGELRCMVQVHPGYKCKGCLSDRCRRWVAWP